MMIEIEGFESFGSMIRLIYDIGGVAPNSVQAKEQREDQYFGRDVKYSPL